VISMRSFYILNRRITSDPSSPRSNGTIPRSTGWRERLRYRDMIWAFHSESQELLLSTSTAACNGRMLWSDARALGIFIWLNSTESLVCTRSWWCQAMLSMWACRGLIWNSLPGMNTWLATTVTPQHVRSSISHSAR
jgi:hypothetical protein